MEIGIKDGLNKGLKENYNKTIKKYDLEIKIYELLGIKNFKRFVLYNEKFKCRKFYKMYITNYHLKKWNDDSVERFVSMLIYNMSIHLFGVIISVCALVYAILFLDNYIVLFLTFCLLGHLFCVLLQRYNYLRIKKLLEKRKKYFIHTKNRFKEKLKSVDIEYSNGLLKEDIRLLSNIIEAYSKDIPIVLDDSQKDGFARLSNFSRGLFKCNVSGVNEASFFVNNAKFVDKKYIDWLTRPYGRAESFSLLLRRFNNRIKSFDNSFMIITDGEEIDNVFFDFIKTDNINLIMERIKILESILIERINT